MPETEVTPPPPAPDASTLPAPPPPPPITDDPPLGPQGEQALAAFKERARTAEAEVKRLAAVEAELAEVRAGQMTEQEKAIAAARQEAAEQTRTEITGSVNERLFRAAVQVAAATDIPAADGKTVRLSDPSLLADPEVARRLLGFDEIPVTPTGDIDAEAISAAVAAFATAKPSLTASATPLPGTADQGARTPPTVRDLNTQIQEAEAAGDWTLVGQLKLQKLAALPRP